MSTEILWVIAGIVLRTVVPYLISYIESGGKNPFDWKYLLSIVVAAVMTYLVSLVDPSVLDNITGLIPYLGAGIGWFSTDLGRELQKLLAIWIPFLRTGGQSAIEPA